MYIDFGKRYNNDQTWWSSFSSTISHQVTSTECLTVCHIAGRTNCLCRFHSCCHPSVTHHPWLLSLFFSSFVHLIAFGVMQMYPTSLLYPLASSLFHLPPSHFYSLSLITFFTFLFNIFSTFSVCSYDLSAALILCCRAAGTWIFLREIP